MPEQYALAPEFETIFQQENESELIPEFEAIVSGGKNDYEFDGDDLSQGASPPPQNDFTTLFIRGLIAIGNRDENQLTNLVFFTRHPELGGQKLTPGLPNYASLSQEWLQIRNNVIRPLLPGTLPSAPVPAQPTLSQREIQLFISRINPYLFYLNFVRQNIPLSFILGWIKVESGGKYGDEVTSNIALNERGFFQISIDESKSIKADHRRITSDPYYSINMGISLIKYYANIVMSHGFNTTDEIFLKLVKFCHSAGTGSLKGIILKMKQANQMPKTWDQFKSFLFNPANRIGDINRFMKTPKRFTDNVEKVFKYGEQILKVIGA